MSQINDHPTSGWLSAGSVSALVVFFLVPLAIMVGVSFAHRVPGAFFEPGFELNSYAKFMTPFFGRILLTSLAIAAAVAVICVCLAFPFTVWLAQMGPTAQTRILVLLLSILSLSEVIIGFSLSTILSKTAGVGNLLAWVGILSASRAFTPGLFALITGLCYLGFPYAVLVLYPPVSRLDPELAEAARTMGASQRQAFFGVLLPALRAPVIGALMLVFVFTLGAYLLPQILGRPQHWTLSVHITDQALFQSNLPFAAAMAILLLIVTLVLVGVTLLVGAERKVAP